MVLFQVRRHPIRYYAKMKSGVLLAFSALCLFSACVISFSSSVMLIVRVLYFVDYSFA